MAHGRAPEQVHEIKMTLEAAEVDRTWDRECWLSLLRLPHSLRDLSLPRRDLLRVRICRNYILLSCLLVLFTSKISIFKFCQELCCFTRAR